MSSSSQIVAPSSIFKSMLDTALAEYQKKTGDDLLAHWLATELQTCESVDGVLNILRDQAKAFERSGDQKLMKWIDPLVHVLYTFSGALGDGVSLAFPPAKVIFTGIGVLLAAAKGVRASHAAIIDLFERIESFFKRLEVYTEISLSTKMAEVLVKIVIELLSILSIATKEVKRWRAKIFARKLLGRTDIEDALKKLDNLIQEEFQMVTAQILKVTTEAKDDAGKANMVMQQDMEEVMRDVLEVKRDVEEVKWTQIEKEIYKWLSPPDPSTNYNIACETHQEGTAAWFFQSKKFQDWTSNGSLLWIHGKPGSGKSILCSAIITYVMSLRDAGQASLAYFYFDFRDKDKKQDFRNFVTSLLVQLSAHSSPCCKIISQIYSTYGKGTREPSKDALTDCLREMLSIAAEQPIYIIVDALDECPNASGMPTPREIVLDLLEGIVRLGLPNLHICVTSRPEIDIKNVLGPLASAVSLHEEIGQKKDISDYVSNVVHADRKMRTWRDEEKKLVVGELSNKADGMFRWVFCQLEVLRHCFPANIRQTLRELPESLDDTYARVLREINKTNQGHAHRMLQCLMVAVRPLRVEELAELLAFEFDAAQGGIPKYRSAWRLGASDQTQAVLSTCSSLITIVNSSRYGRQVQVVQFSHFSVKEFLMSDRLTSALGDFSHYHIRPGSAHTILTQACLGSLLHSGDHNDEERLEMFPLVEYAARHWVEHAQFGDVASRVRDGMETLFDPDKPHFAAWIKRHDIDDGRTSRNPNPNPLYYSVLCGFYDTVKHLAVKHPQYVDAICGQYKFSLLAALSKDHVEVAELLLEHGANVNVRELTGKTILLKVLSGPQRNLVNKVMFLLKHGADVNVQDGALRTALHLAEYRGELEVAEMLVKHKADTNSRDGDGKAPLHILLGRRMYSKDDVLYHARLLLEHGADVSVENINGKTPLHLVSDSRIHNDGDARDLVQLLLEHGAVVNGRDRNNQTPLHLAMGRDLFKLAQILLEHGADANAENNNGWAPLHLLSECHIYDEGNVGDVPDPMRLCQWLERGVGINARDESHTTLSYLRPNFDLDQVTRALLDHGAKVNARNNGGGAPLYQKLEGTRVQIKNQLTPLHLASLYGRLDIARVLLDRGATVDPEDNFGRTPLHLVAHGTYCFEQDRVRITELLLEHGADVNAQDKGNVTPLHFASYNERVAIARVLLDRGAAANSTGNHGRTPLHSVIEGRYIYSENDGIRVTQLLLERGADVNALDEDKRTPLHVACYYGRTEVTQVMLDGGVDANSKDNQAPLHAVVESGDYHSRDKSVLVARLLLEHGADVNVPDDDNQTPLHLASYLGKARMVLVLLNASANVSTTNAQGQTPLHLVSQYPYYSRGSVLGVAQLLLKHGADVNAQDENYTTPLDLASYQMTNQRTSMASLLLNSGGKANAKISQCKGQRLVTPRRLGLAGVQSHGPPSTYYRDIFCDGGFPERSVWR